jgi:hypothetical protein
MVSFLEAETGPLAGRRVAILPTGPLSEVENRLLRRFADSDVDGLRFPRSVDPAGLPELGGTTVEFVPARELGRDASAVVLAGGGSVPSVSPQALLAGARQRVLAFTRRELDPGVSAGDIASADLSRRLSAEKLEQQAAEAAKSRFRNIWIVIISLLVTVIGISNAMLMSVTERFREIGTMKCLGALSGFVRTLFLIESGLMGLVGGVVGVAGGVLFSVVAYSFSYGIALIGAALRAGGGELFLSMGAALAAGIFLSILAAIYPAKVASDMVPAAALRTNV